MQINGLSSLNTTNISYANNNNNNNNKNNNKNNKNKSRQVSFEGHNLTKVFNDPNYKNLKVFVYELTNGQKVVIVPKKGPGATTVNTVVKTGGLNEPDNLRGISHFMEHLAFDGSRKGAFDKGLKPRSFDKIMRSKGAYINAHTGNERTAYFFNITNVTPKDFDEALKAHATMVKYPSLPPKQYKKEQQVVIQEIKQSKDKPEVKTYYTLVKNLLGINSKSEHLVLGEESNIENTTRKDVFNYHKINYTPNNMETFVVGDVKPEKIIKIIDKYFDTPDFRPSNTPRIFEEIHPIENTKIEFLSDPKIKNANVSVAFNGPQNSDAKESVAANALMFLLGLDKSSRYNKKLLDLGTESSVGIYHTSNHPKNPLMLIFDIDIKPGQEQKTLNSLMETIKELKTSPISKKELDIVKKNMLNSFNRECENSDKISNILESFSTTGGIDAYENHVENIKNLTLDDINNIANKYLNTEKASITVLQPEAATNTNISFKGKTSLISPKNLKKTILPNNIKLLINDNSDTVRTALNLKLESDIKAKTGVPEIFAQMLQISTSKHTQEELAEIKSNEAMDIFVSDTARGLEVTTNSLSESLPKALTTLKEMLFSPKLNEENFQNAMIETQLSAQRRPTSALDRALETMYPKQPFGQTQRLLMQEIDKVTLEDIQKYHKELFRNPNISVSVTGPISQTEGLTKNIISELNNIDKTFNAKKLAPLSAAPAITSNKVALQIEQGRTQSEIVQLFHIKPENLEEIASLKVLNTILGEGLSARLFLDLREKQHLAYHVKSFMQGANKDYLQYFYIKTGIKDGDGNVTDNIEKSLLGFEKHQQKLIKQVPTTLEVEQAKKTLTTGFIKAFSTVGLQNSNLIQSMDSQYGPTYHNKLMKAIHKVTPEDVKNVAKKYFSQPSVTSVLTTEEAAKNSENFLKTRGEFKLYENAEIDT